LGKGHPPVVQAMLDRAKLSRSPVEASSQLKASFVIAARDLSLHSAKALLDEMASTADRKDSAVAYVETHAKTLTPKELVELGRELVLAAVNDQKQRRRLVGPQPRLRIDVDAIMRGEPAGAVLARSGKAYSAEEESVLTKATENFDGLLLTYVKSRPNLTATERSLLAKSAVSQTTANELMTLASPTAP
jgi:hypothetical protein